MGRGQKEREGGRVKERLEKEKFTVRILFRGRLLFFFFLWKNKYDTKNQTKTFKIALLQLKNDRSDLDLRASESDTQCGHTAVVTV